MANATQQYAIYRRFLATARRAAAIYGALARMEPDSERSALFRQLADKELEHARRWSEQIGDAHRIRPSRLGPASILLWLITKMIGTVFIAKFLIRGHERNLHDIARLPDPSLMAEAAREQQMALRRLAYPDIEPEDHPESGGFFSGEGGTLRAAVLGVNDGLVSNFSLVMGVAGGTGDAEIIVLAGVAGLLAGAFSMAAGEYISMRSQKDVYENIVRLEQAELNLWPEREQAELAGFFEEKGLKPEEASTVARRISENPDITLDMHLREEFGLDREDLGSPWGAAFASMTAFALGAIVPVFPYFFGDSWLVFALSTVFSILALVTVGAGLAWMSGVNVLWGGARMLLAGGVAAAVTFGVGTAIGQAIT